MKISGSFKSQSFDGILIGDEKLKKRIKNDSTENLANIYSQLKRMKSYDDNKVYRYKEYTVDTDIPGLYQYDSYAAIVDENGKELKCIEIASYNEFAGEKRAPANFISKLISSFTNEYYPLKKDKKAIQQNIFDILG